MLLNMTKLNKIASFILIILILSCTSKRGNKTKDILQDKTFPDLKINRYNVAFLIMDGVYNTEFTAPFDIFQHTIFRDSIKAMNVFSVVPSPLIGSPDSVLMGIIL